MSDTTRSLDYDPALAYVSRDADTAEDRAGPYAWIIDAYEDPNPAPFSFRAYDLTSEEANELLAFYRKMKSPN